MDRFDLTDDEWAVIEPHVPNRGRAAGSDEEVLYAVIWNPGD